MPPAIKARRLTPLEAFRKTSATNTMAIITTLPTITVLKTTITRPTITTTITTVPETTIILPQTTTIRETTIRETTTQPTITTIRSLNLLAAPSIIIEDRITPAANSADKTIAATKPAETSTMTPIAATSTTTMVVNKNCRQHHRRRGEMSTLKTNSNLTNNQHVRVYGVVLVATVASCIHW